MHFFVSLTKIQEDCVTAFAYVKKKYAFLCPLIFASTCFLLGILPYWNKAIIPGRFIVGTVAVAVLCCSSALRERLLRTPAFYAMCVYTVSCAASTLANGLPFVLCATSVAWLCTFFAFWCVGSMFGESARVPFLVLGIAVLSMLVGYLALGQEGLGIINESAFQESQDRIVGTFKNQGNRLGMLLAVAGFFALGGGFAAKKPGIRAALWCLGLLLFFFLINAGTRTWTILFFCAVAGYLVFHNIRAKYIFLGGAITLLTIAALYLSGAPQMQLYFCIFEQGVQSALSRIPMWQLAWDLFLENPLLGVGPEQFRVFYKAHFAANLAMLPPAERFFAIPSTTHAHNIFLSPLAESGLCGALGLACAMVFSLVSGMKRQGVLRDAAWVLGLVIFVGMINPSLGREPGTVLAAVTGLAASVPYLRQPCNRATAI